MFGKGLRNDVRMIAAALVALIVLAAGIAAAGTEYAWADESSQHLIAVASDRHDTPSAIATAMKGMPDSVEYVCLDGDMTDAERGGRPSESASGSSMPDPPDNGGSRKSGQKAYNTSTVADEVRSVFPDLTNDSISIIYAGHDANATDDAGIMKCADASMLPAGSDSSEISAGFSGLIFEGPDGNDEDSLPDYYIYGVSFFDMQNTGVTEITDEEGNVTGTEEGAGAKKSAEAFKSWVDAVNESDPDVPIIVFGHVPLHYKRNDNLGATYWSRAFNYAATGSEEGGEIRREVAYIHGHNHTVEKTEYLVTPGEELTLQGPSSGASENAVIYYTYATGGYLRDNHTATLITVDGTDLTFTKYKGCVVTFDATGGSSTAALSAQEGDLISKPSDPVREGWVFTGWYTEAACENLFDFTSELTDDITLYAGWVRGVRPDAPALSLTVNASGKKASLSWTGSSGASDYRVCYRKAGASSWTRKWSNGKKKYTVSGLDKKGLYEFKVNAASESGDRMIYSPDSETVRGYISSLAGVKAKARKSSFRVTWKKDSKASGCQIKYSQAKNMKNAITVNVSKGKTAHIVKGLKSKKKYYVKVRPLVSTDGSTYYGAWSGIKTVTVK